MIRLRDIMLAIAVRLALGFGLIVASAGGGCGGTQAGKTFTGTFSACAKANLAQIVGGSDGKTLLDDVRDRIAKGSSTLAADLDSLALTVGLDAVECAVAAVIAVLSPAQAGSGKTTGAEPPGVAIARDWLHAHAGSGANEP